MPGGKASLLVVKKQRSSILWLRIWVFIPLAKTQYWLCEGSQRGHKRKTWGISISGGFQATAKATATLTKCWEQPCCESETGLEPSRAPSHPTLEVS